MSISESRRVTVGSQWTQVLLATRDPWVRRLFTELTRIVLPGALLQIATTAQEARSTVRRTKPELVLLDSALVQQARTDLIHDACRARSTACVVVVGATGQYSHLMSALHSGASACLVTEDSPDALVRQFRAILNGDLALSPSAACAVFGQFRRLLPSAGQTGRLSTQESEALKCAAAGMTLTDAAQRMGIRHATARTYLRRAYTKLGIGSRAQDSQAAIALGLL